MTSEELKKIKFEIEQQQIVLNIFEEKYKLYQRELIINSFKNTKYSIGSKTSHLLNITLIPDDICVFEKLCKDSNLDTQYNGCIYILENPFLESGSACYIQFESPNKFWIETSFGFNDEELKIMIKEYQLDIYWSSLEKTLIEDKNDLLDQIKEIDNMLESLKC